MSWQVFDNTARMLHNRSNMITTFGRRTYSSCEVRQTLLGVSVTACSQQYIQQYPAYRKLRAMTSPGILPKVVTCIYVTLPSCNLNQVEHRPRDFGFAATADGKKMERPR